MVISTGYILGLTATYHLHKRCEPFGNLPHLRMPDLSVCLLSELGCQEPTGCYGWIERVKDKKGVNNYIYSSFKTSFDQKIEIITLVLLTINTGLSVLCQWAHMIMIYWEMLFWKTY